MCTHHEIILQLFITNSIVYCPATIFENRMCVDRDTCQKGVILPDII